MSQYTTDQVLQMLEEWAEDNPGGPLGRFQGFDGLLGADLSEIDLSADTIQQKAQEYQNSPANGGADPPWLRTDLSGTGATPGLNLCFAVLSADAEGQRANFRDAQLQGALLWDAHLQGARLEGAQLQGAGLQHAQLGRADLGQAQLQGANLGHAQLQRAHLWGAQLQGAYLEFADLQGAYLWSARLQGAQLDGVEFDQVKLEDVDWRGEQRFFWFTTNGYTLAEGPYDAPEAVYRRLKRWYSNNGQYHHAGEFHKQEMRTRRKGLWRARTYSEAAYLGLMGLLSGYGERPSWTLGWTMLAWAGFALVYWLLGALEGQALPGVFLAELWGALYVSGTAMLTFEPHLLPGYPPVSVEPWAGAVALLQGAIAYFLLALFLVTFVQKASRQ